MKAVFPWRIAILGGLCGAVLLVSVRSLIDPSWGKPAPFPFPQSLSLANWQFKQSSSKPIKAPGYDPKAPPIPGYEYEFRRSQNQLTLTLSYWLNNQGDLGSYIQSSFQLKSSSSKDFPKWETKQTQVGYHALYTYQGKAYLSACLNPRSSSVVNGAQMAANRQQVDLVPQRMLPVLLGMETLRDWRCLWASLSVPVQNHQTQVAYQTLEQAWLNLNQNWQPPFP